MRRIFALLLLACGCGPRGAAPDAGTQVTFAAAADEAAGALGRYYYAGGAWNGCVPSDQCYTDDVDWGADSMTDTLFLRWEEAPDAGEAPMLRALGDNAEVWPACNLPSCGLLSDVPSWDSVALSRIYTVTRDGGALARAESDFAMVDESNAFALGACPAIDYQQAGAADGGNELKTLETDSNYVKAALLLWEETSERAYLDKAAAKYAAIRRYFLDPEVPLYTAFVFDDGGSCWQLPRRFFASVNGNLIWAGVHLAAATGDGGYLADAVATGGAVARDLNDSSGLYDEMQSEFDVVEPLVEGMEELAKQGQDFARDWILTNATAARASRTPQGIFGRHLDGPPPRQAVTEWESNGGFALAFAAASLAPGAPVAPDPFWASAAFVDAGFSDPPFSLSFRGRGIALVGTIGDVCCKPGHARVLVDGTETFDETGIWQNASPTQTSLPGSILFAWRWPDAGSHTLDFEPGAYDPHEGGSYLHLTGYEVVP